LRQWFTEGHISLGAIGLTAYLGLPYTIKFLWAPVLDQVSPPGRLARFGRRRGWLLTAQPLLALACACLALSGGPAAPLIAVCAALAIAFLSATQDIAIDAWRIEIFPARLQGAANAVYVWGYRFAMLVSGGGAIYFAGVLGWSGALLCVAVLAALAIPVTLAAPEPGRQSVRLRPQPPAPRGRGAKDALAALLRAARSTMKPLGDFLARPGAIPILAYVALFNLGEAIAGVMLSPFYRSLGFDRGAVARTAGPYTLPATIVGIGLGGWLVARLGVARALIATGFFQMAAMAMYIVLSLSHGDEAMLYATVVIEAFAQGLATAAFLAYLSGLCSPAHAATQFALLTSIAPLAANTVGGFSGYLAAATGWTLFYTLAMLASLPGMLLMLWILHRYPPEAAEPGATL
jgi:PAT family beta-lactamase induction signal transducer AmpG